MYQWSTHLGGCAGYSRVNVLMKPLKCELYKAHLPNGVNHSKVEIESLEVNIFKIKSKLLNP